MINWYAFGVVSPFAQDLVTDRPSRRGSRPAPVVRVALAASLLLGSAVISAGEYFGRDGVALRGYDPVSYFTEGKPQPGLPAHSYLYKGSRFQFASADNQRLFAENPDKYAPQFGGFCA